jgi:hypothetical protein
LLPLLTSDQHKKARLLDETFASNQAKILTTKRASKISLACQYDPEYL